ncbi:hypothetical protein Tco_1411891 [Tanacetum coccineum]
MHLTSSSSSCQDWIRIDAFWESGDKPFSRVHECSFAWNMKDLGKVVERKNDLNVSNDKGNGNCLVDISSDPNTLVEFEDKQRTNLFVDNQKTIKVDGGKYLANAGVIKKNNRNVKCQDEEQISMRKLEYRVKEHYERDDDDDHDGTKDLRDVSIDEGIQCFE